MITQVAFTPPDSNYPPYINFSKDEQTGDVKVTVRSPRNPEGDCGTTSAFNILKDDWNALMDDLIIAGF